MSIGGACRCALLALAVATPAAAEPRAQLRDFDVSVADNWPDALALCDLTAFLKTRPALEASVVFLPHASGWLQPLQAPRFAPPNDFVSHTVRRSFERLEAHGEIDRASYNKARARHDMPMFASYRRAGAADLAFIDNQQRLCGFLAQEIAERYPVRTAAIPPEPRRP